MNYSVNGERLPEMFGRDGKEPFSLCWRSSLGYTKAILKLQDNFQKTAYSSLKLLPLTLAANFCITKSISCFLIKLHFYKQVSSLRYDLLFQQSQMQNKTAVGCPHVPACSLWEGKQRWILPREIIQRCCCPPQCTLFIFSPESAAVLLFYPAVNYLDTAPV